MHGTAHGGPQMACSRRLRPRGARHSPPYPSATQRAPHWHHQAPARGQLLHQFTGQARRGGPHVDGVVGSLCQGGRRAGAGRGGGCSSTGARGTCTAAAHTPACHSQAGGRTRGPAQAPVPHHKLHAAWQAEQGGAQGGGGRVGAGGWQSPAQHRARRCRPPCASSCASAGSLLMLRRALSCSGGGTLRQRQRAPGTLHSGGGRRAASPGGSDTSSTSRHAGLVPWARLQLGDVLDAHRLARLAVAADQARKRGRQIAAGRQGSSLSTPSALASRPTAPRPACCRCMQPASSQQSQASTPSTGAHPPTPCRCPRPALLPPAGSGRPAAQARRRACAAR